MTAPHLSTIPDDGPFAYPIHKADRLDGHSFVKWQHQRWLASDMHLMASYEVQGMARALFDLAQNQSPPGTLPMDRVVVARMLRVDPHHFESLCRHAYGPLRGWQPCLIDDGELRLYHAVVLEQVQDAFDRREARAVANNTKAIKARQVRMISELRAMGCNEALLRDAVLIERMEAWLTDHWKARRGPSAYERVLGVAQREGWFAPQRGV